MNTIQWGPRGTCPDCGSGEVFHDMLGMPTMEAVQSAPPWVSFGCVPTFRDRHCGDCGAQWSVPEPDEGDAEDDEEYDGLEDEG